MGRFEELGTALDFLFGKILNRNFNKADELIQKTEQELSAHKSSTKAHDASTIAYSGAVVGAENTKQAIDNLKDEVNTIVASAGDGTKDTELILARGNEDTLGDRLDATDAQLADIKKTRTGDISYNLQQDGFKTVITGDSLSYNRYGFDNTYRENAYDCFPGMLSWSFMIRDAIHRNDANFVHADDVKFRNIRSNTIFSVSSASAYTMPFNNRFMTIGIRDNTEEIIITYKHDNPANKIILHLGSNPNNSSCSFDVYVDNVLSVNINNNGAGKKFQGFEPLVVELTGSAGVLHEIKLTNFVQTAGTPESSGLRNVYLLGIGSKNSPVYLTGSGGKTSQWLLTNLESRILDYNPGLVIITLGANDRATIAINQFESNMRSIVERIRTHNENTLIMFVSPPSARNEANPSLNDGTYKPDSVTEKYIDVLRKISYEFKCYFLDTMLLFEQMPISQWRFDNVHFTKTGNTILARTCIGLLMENGLYDKKMLDSNLSFAHGNVTYKNNPDPIHGWVYVTYNGSSNNYQIESQSSNDVLSVQKVNDYTLRVNFRYGTVTNGKNGFVFSATIAQYGPVSKFLIPRFYLNGMNNLDFVISKLDGNVVNATDLATPGDFKFLIRY